MITWFIYLVLLKWWNVAGSLRVCSNISCTAVITTHIFYRKSQSRNSLLQQSHVTCFRGSPSEIVTWLCSLCIIYWSISKPTEDLIHRSRFSLQEVSDLFMRVCMKFDPPAPHLFHYPQWKHVGICFLLH